MLFLFFFLSFFEFFFCFFWFKFWSFWARARAPGRPRPPGLPRWLAPLGLVRGLIGLARLVHTSTVQPHIKFLTFRGLLGFLLRKPWEWSAPPWELLEAAHTGENFMSTNGAAIHHNFSLSGSSWNSDVERVQAYTAVLEIVVALVSTSCRFNSSLDETHTQGCQPLRQPKYLTVLSKIRWNNIFFGIQVFFYIPLNLYPLSGLLSIWLLAISVNVFFARFQSLSFIAHTISGHATILLALVIPRSDVFGVFAVFFIGRGTRHNFKAEG